MTSLALEPEGGSTRLVVKADEPFDYQVELTDPQSVLIRIPDAILTTSLPQPQPPDRVVRAVEAGYEGGVLNLVVRTASPGVTVLPTYQAAGRRLSVELGGPPSLEVNVTPQEGAAPSPEVSGGAAPPPAAPVRRNVAGGSIPSPPPLPGAEPAVPAGPGSAETPATAPPAGDTGFVPTPAEPRPPRVDPVVKAVRMGTHTGYTRVVLDADAPLDVQFQSGGRSGFLSLTDGRLAPGASIGRPQGGVTAVKVLRDNPLTLELTLERPVAQQRVFTMAGGKRGVVDIKLSPPGGPEPVPAQAAKAAPGAPETPADGAAPAQAPPQPGLRPAQASGPTAFQAAERTPESPAAPAPAAGPVTGVESPLAALPTPQDNGGPRPSEALMEKAGRLSARDPMAGRASVAPDQPYMARGSMPPLPAPSPLAMPKDKPVQASPAASPAAPPQEAQTAAASVVERVKEARDEKDREAQALKDAALPKEPQASPVPQGVDGLAFQRAKDALDRRDYAAAFQLFSTFLTDFPQSTLAGQATFRLADAFFYRNERNMLPAYDQTMLLYQRAIDLYPDSDQVPWALLMMGKSAMLGEEPYKALGYFDLVIQDYPKSEYVPLAMISRGQAFLAQSKWRPAMEEFMQTSERYPDSRYRKDSDWGLAQAMFGLGRYRQASLVLQDMNQRYPELHREEPELLYHIGEAEFQMQDYTKARDYFLWALNIRPDIRDGDVILTRVGDTYKFQGDNEAAKDIYRQVLEKFPETDGALVARIRMAESPEVDREHQWDIFQVKADLDAYRTYKDISEKYPDRQVGQLAQVKLAIYYYKKQEFQKSLWTLEKLAQTHPNSPFRAEIDYTMNLAVMGLLQKLKKEDKPLHLMEAYLRNQGLLLRPNGNDILEMLAWAYEKTGLNQRAVKMYQVLLSRGLNQPTLHLGLARNLMPLKDYKGVVDSLEKVELARMKEDDQREVHSLLGRALSELGRHDEAQRILHQNVMGEPNYPGVELDLRARAHSLAALGSYAEALSDLARAEAMYKARKDPVSKMEEYLVAMEEGDVAKKAAMMKEAAEYYQKAADLAPKPDGKAQALYELAMVHQATEDVNTMADVLVTLAKMKVAPWSDMALRVLGDYRLAERLVQVGK